MPRIAPNDTLTVGQLAKRAGLTVPTIRYYEQRGLIAATRSGGNQRQFPRHALRRLAVIAAGQVVGLSLKEIGEALTEVPLDRAPTQRQWDQMSRKWATAVQSRIDRLSALQASLDGCIGCGCLSLGKCTLFNPADEAAADGPGSRWLRNASNL